MKPSDQNHTAKLAVCGLHLKGFPLEYQLTRLGAKYLGCFHTAPVYRLFALNTVPPKPGLVRTGQNGASIELELWALTYESLGKFLVNIPSPLGLGKIMLDSSEEVTGFLCEPYALDGAADISGYRGWRNYCLK